MLEGENADRLRAILEVLNAPTERKKIRDDSDLHWLGRNLWINNPQSVLLDEARDLMEAMGARLVM